VSEIASDRLETTRDRVIGLLALAVAVAAMTIDHLVGTEDGDDDAFPVDPAMFAISVAVSLATAALLFGWLVPRERRRGPERAARSGLVCSVLSVIPGVAFLWVGFPFVVAGAGVALGLDGREGSRKIEAGVAVVVGALMLVLGAIAYLVAALG
jgi:hypothetical protein